MQLAQKDKTLQENTQ